MVGLTTGRPVLELADLLVALRAYPPGEPRGMFIGCTIDPTAEGLSRLQQFQRQIPREIPEDQRGVVAEQVAQGVRESLGMAKIRVFGVPAETHFAAVLIEADYRMKLIGLGLERPPVKIASMLELSGSASMGTLQRWWFTPNYSCVKTTDDRLSLELVGQGVQLLSESKLVGPDGQLAAAAAPNKASEAFAAGFTRQYPALSVVSPVYAQMRNLIDMGRGSGIHAATTLCRSRGLADGDVRGRKIAARADLANSRTGRSGGQCRLERGATVGSSGRRSFDSCRPGDRPGTAAQG